MPRPNPEELEQHIHRTLRALPDRRAPRSLEARVLAAIAAQQALPWWRQSFAHWPLPVRVTFLVVTATLAAVLAAMGLRLADGVETTSLLSGPLTFLAQVQAVVGGIGDFCAAVLRSIPKIWLYGAVAFVGALYAMLLGLGAAAYRFFFFQR